MRRWFDNVPAWVLVLAFLPYVGLLVGAGFRSGVDKPGIATINEDNLTFNFRYKDLGIPTRGDSIDLVLGSISGGCTHGYWFIREDVNGDSLCWFMGNITSGTEDFLIFGPYGGINSDIGFGCGHSLGIMYSGASNCQLEKQGSGQAIWDVDTTLTIDSQEVIAFRQRWWKKTPSTSDTLLIDRTVTLRRDNPYLLVRYDITFYNQVQAGYGPAQRDSIPRQFRMYFAQEPYVGLASEAARNDVFWIPGEGMRMTRACYTAAQCGYYVGWADVGCSLYVVPGDTVSTGARAWPAGGEPSTLLKRDAGSGTSKFICGFAAFNPACSAAPHEFILADTSFATGLQGAHVDSPYVRIADVTEPMGHTSNRAVHVRTGMITVFKQQTLTIEYALGESAYQVGKPYKLVPPDVVFSDGNRISCQN